jgi:alkylation response protein AidB-like acyl-CoA dehydrogenase
MSTTPHPSSFIAQTILSEIRSYGAEAERLKTLHDRQLALIYDQSWFKMFVPKDHGGLENTLPEVLEIEEALAWADGSTSWVVTLCSGAGWFFGFLDPTAASKIFNNKMVCLAGSGAPSGAAEITSTGFRINGTWKYASGALNASMFTANCVITKNNKPILNPDGTPVIKAFVVSSEKVLLTRNWNSMGMIATASHGFTISDLDVEENQAFQINNEHTKHSGSVYRYPFLQLAEATLAVNYSGMTQQFVDLCEPIFQKRMNDGFRPIKDLMQLHLNAKEELQIIRDQFYHDATLSWKACSVNSPDQILLHDRVSKASHELYRICLKIIDSLYPYTGLTGANTENEINRVWRNFHTASQHTLFSLR